MDLSSNIIDASAQIQEFKNCKEINGWTLRGQTQMAIFLNRLKFNKVINTFFLHELKNKEGKLSWYIIVISSFSSVLSLANTSSNFFPYSSIVIKTLLILFTLITTLLGAYIKKQQFIERINNIDRYLQILNKTVEEINIGASILEPSKRLNYGDFCNKYIPLIQELSVTPDSLSPKELKRIVYTITKYHEELISVDGSNEEKLWPWYEMTINNQKPRKRTEFYRNVLKKNFDEEAEKILYKEHISSTKPKIRIEPFNIDIDIESNIVSDELL
jgi:hypothetical protein